MAVISEPQVTYFEQKESLFYISLFCVKFHLTLNEKLYI